MLYRCHFNLNFISSDCIWLEDRKEHAHTGVPCLRKKQLQGCLPDVARNCTNVNVQAKPKNQILSEHSEIYQYPVCLFAHNLARKICPFCFATTVGISRSFYKKKIVWCLAWIRYSLSIFKTNELPTERAWSVEFKGLIFTHICNTQFVLFCW